MFWSLDTPCSRSVENIASNPGLRKTSEKSILRIRFRFARSLALSLPLPLSPSLCLIRTYVYIYIYIYIYIYMCVCVCAYVYITWCSPSLTDALFLVVLLACSMQLGFHRRVSRLKAENGPPLFG